MALSAEGRRLLRLRDRIVKEFRSSDWIEVGVLTDSSDVIEKHPRLLRSFSFGDDDYSADDVRRRLTSEKIRILTLLDRALLIRTATSA